MECEFINFDYIKENEIVSSDHVDKIKLLLEQYFTFIEDELKDNKEVLFNLTDISSITLLISECYDISDNKTRLEKIIDSLLNILKEQLYDDKVIKGLSFFGGITDIAFSLKLISEKNKKYKNLYLTINQLVFSQLERYSKALEYGKNELSMLHFDFIIGASGVLKYLLEFKKGEIENFEFVESLIKYLHSIVENGYNKIPKWYVKNQNNFPIDQVRFPKGSINYSLSHGIVSVLAVLKEASDKWGLDYLNTSLEKISHEIWEIRTEDNGIPYWPGMISYEKYVNNDFRVALENKRMSWCYGSLGVLIILEKQFSFSGKLHESKKIENSIIDIANMPIDEYEFVSPTICHGFSGMIVMLNSKYKLLKNEVIRTQLQCLTEKVISFHSMDSTGFKNVETFNKNGKNETTIETSHYLLSGTPGILLSLISLIKPTHFEKHLLM